MKIKNYNPPKRGAPVKYPWNEWFDGSTYRLQRGKDFVCQPRSMANYIRDKSKMLNGYSCSVHVDGDDVVIDPH